MDVDNAKIEELANWTFPGLTLYYRDTNLTDEQLGKYQINEYMRNNFFTDVSSFSGGVIGNTRYIIASAHAAPVYEVMQDNPDLARWKLHILNANTYFKVLSIEKRDEKTQILLLHIPRRWVELIPEGTTQISLEQKVIEAARSSFDQKLRLPPAEELSDPEWQKRTELSIGLDANENPFSLQWSEEVTTIPLYTAISKLVNDSTELNK